MSNNSRRPSSVTLQAAKSRRTALRIDSSKIRIWEKPSQYGQNGGGGVMVFSLSLLILINNVLNAIVLFVYCC